MNTARVETGARIHDGIGIVRATIRRTRPQEDYGSFDPEKKKMYQITTPLNSTTLVPLRRSSIGYRHREPTTGLKLAAIVASVAVLALVFGLLL